MPFFDLGSNKRLYPLVKSPLFGVLTVYRKFESPKIRRVVPNSFPTSRFSRLLQAQQDANDELRVEKECPKLVRVSLFSN